MFKYEYFINFAKFRYVSQPKPQGCILCHVRDNDNAQVERLIVYQNRQIIVSVNLYPFNPGHLLIFPCRHVEDIRQLTASEEKAISRARNQALELLQNIYHCENFNIGYNMGVKAGASIPHIHLHIIPRYGNEYGIADLLANRRVMTEDPRQSAKKIAAGWSDNGA